MKTIPSKLLLLDVNVLLALAWPNHQFHAEAQSLHRAARRWATCAITELGFIRLSANPAFTAFPKRPDESAILLEEMLQDPRHTFLARLASPLSPAFRQLLAGVTGHRQTTDAYLLALAADHDAVLATFDSRLPHLAHGAPVLLLP